MSSKPQRSGRDERDDEQETQQERKTVIRVKRGALRRFDQLTRKSANLPVEVKWDRRTSERRSSPAPQGEDRRSNERRQPAPFTWDAADFLVEGDHSGTGAPPDPASKRRDKDGN
jgi:hypothetical protein